MSDIPIIELDDFRKPRIAVLCLSGLESFLGDIVTYLEKNYVVRTCYSRDMSEIESAVSWCDLCWIEWANQLAVEVTQKMPILAEKQVLVRLHSYEALSNFCPQINWTVVDSLLFVAEHIRNIVLQQLPKLPEIVSISVVPNGVEV